MSQDTFISSFAAIQRLYAEPEATARTWKAEGGKVIGVLGGTVPLELITAAGMLPLRLKGDPRLSTAEADRYMEPVREGYLRSIFERLLAGHFDFLDLLVVPRSSEGLLQFYYLVEHVRTTEPARKLPDFYLFDLLQTPFDYTTRYVRARIEDLRAKLETIAGSSIDEAAIRAATTRHDRARHLFQTINTLRHNDAPAFSGITALQLAGCGQTSPIDQFITLLENLRSARPGQNATLPRLMVKGSPHECTDFYALVEAQGAVIVADDHDWGERLYDHLVEPKDDVMGALTSHYQSHAISPRLFLQSEEDATFIKMIEAARVDGVIFYLEENDDTLGWDYPAQKRLLDTKGIPSLLLTRQSYFRAAPPAADAIAQFVRSIGR